MGLIKTISVEDKKTGRKMIVNKSDFDKETMKKVKTPVRKAVQVQSEMVKIVDASVPAGFTEVPKDEFDSETMEIFIDDKATPPQ